MTKSKKRNVIVALALVALLAIGGTLAYLTAVTNEVQNTFTMGKGIDGDIDEPSWDPENGKDFYPGKVIAKDPLIKNESEVGVTPAYVAATITYQVKDGEGWKDVSYADLDKFINIKSGTPLENAVPGFNATNWTMDKDNTIAYYKGNATNGGKLAPKTQTEPIFDAVEIDPLALTPDQVASAKGSNVQFDKTKYEVRDAQGNITYTYESYQMSDFQILVKGYLVQSEGFNDVQTAMQTAFPEVFGAAQ